MSGYLLLEGGAEFGGHMAVPDLRAIELAGGLSVRIAILPTAAAPDNNHVRAGKNGLRWFQQLGGTNVAVIPLIDRASAGQPQLLKALRESRLIYLLGGFPGYLVDTLAESPALETILETYTYGAVLGGSSAGAMILCEKFFDPGIGGLRGGLNLIPGTCLIPHHNTFGRSWVERLSALLPDFLFIGIDEGTGMINDGPDGSWNVYGGGTVTLHRRGKPQTFRPGEIISLKDR